VNHVANTITKKQAPTTTELNINPTLYMGNLKASLSKIPNPLVIKTESIKPQVKNDTKKVTGKIKQNNKTKTINNNFNQQNQQSSLSQGSCKFIYLFAFIYINFFLLLFLFFIFYFFLKFKLSILLIYINI